MAVRSNPAEEQLYAACLLNLVLIGSALYPEVRRIAIEDVDIGRLDVHVREEMFVHETMVALGMFPWNTDVFVLFMRISTVQWERKCFWLTMLKVTTLLKEISPALNACTRYLYTISGLLPVGRPSTKGRSSVGANVFMRPNQRSASFRLQKAHRIAHG